MSEVPDFKLPEDFDSTVRLFPLPNVVLFPGVVQALHIFEPRYVKMIERALETDRLITMVLSRPDLASEYTADVPISEIGCLGRILSDVKLEDGRYNLFLVGLKRVTITKELVSKAPYRTAEVKVHEDYSEANLELNSNVLRTQIIYRFQQLAQQNPSWDQETMEQFYDASLPLARVIDMISYAVGFPSLVQQKVLETLDLKTRAELVLAMLEQRVDAESGPSSGREFPPQFSLN